MAVNLAREQRIIVNVRDVAQANYRAGTTPGVRGAFNIASGTRIAINRLAEMTSAASDRPPAIVHGAPRAGDVRHSLADISAARGVRL